MMVMAGWGGFAQQLTRSFFFWLCITFLIVSLGYAVMHNKAELPDTFAVDESCDLHSGACLARSESGKGIELSISPRGIPLLQPLEVIVKLDGMRASSVIVIFSGVDIDMGQLSYPLGTEDGSSFRGTVKMMTQFLKLVAPPASDYSR